MYQKLISSYIFVLCCSMGLFAQPEFNYYGGSITAYNRGDLPFSYIWKAQTYEGVEAIKTVKLSENNPLEGTGSLEINILLDTGNPQLRVGETFIDLRNHAPQGMPPDCWKAPVNLWNMPLFAKAFCPAGLQGTSHAPNGFQLFVKDNQWRTLNGPYVNLSQGVDKWYELSVTPDLVPPPGGSMDGGFDPTKIIALGLRVVANDNWNGAYEGQLWLDEVKTADNSTIHFTFDNPKNVLDDLLEIGANTAAITPTLYMDTPVSNTIYSDPLRTSSDAELISTVQALKAIGIQVVFKPHIDVQDGSWRGHIQPADIDQWFDNYTNIMVGYAHLLAAYDIELFCIGTEFSSLDGQYYSYWSALADTIRQILPNTLMTYSANWQEYQQLSFHDQLDIIGLSAYFPLSFSKNPSLEALSEAWQMWLPELTAFAKFTEKPLMFTEIGYASRDYAARFPWESGEGLSPDSIGYNCALQARCYRAFLEAFCPLPWFEGFLIWQLSPVSGTSSGCCNRHFYIQNKVETIQALLDAAPCKTDAEIDDYGPKLKVMPNPVYDELNIQLPSAVQNNSSSFISITDIKGAEIKNLPLMAGEKELSVDLSELATGLYLIIYKNDEVRYVGRVVKF